MLSAQPNKGVTFYTIKVLVRDSVTHQALSSATVSVKGHRHVHLSDDKGIAVFDSIKSGTAKISVSYIGYHSTVKSITVPGIGLVVVDLCPESFHLHETVITHQKNVDDPTFSNQHKQVLTTSQIEAKRGQNIAELLSEVNGVTQLNSGPNIAKPVIRGLHSNRLVMLNAGVRQEGQQWGAEHGPEIDPFIANRIEVIKGASAVEFGADAIGGVVRISPRDYRRERGIGGELSLNGYSNNRQGAGSLLVEGTHLNQEKFSWRIQGSLRKAGDSKSSSYIISNTGFEEQNASVALKYGWSKWTSELYYSHYRSKLGIFIGAHMGNVDDLTAALGRDKPLVINSFTYNIARPYQQVQHDLLSSKFSYLHDGGKFVIQLSAQQNQRQEYDTDRPFNQALRNRPAFDLTLRSLSTDIKWEHKPLKRYKGKIGLSWMVQDNTADGVSFIIPDFNANTVGVFLMEKKETEKWTFEAGVRYDFRWLDAKSNRRFNELNEQRNFQSINGIVSAVRILPKNWLWITTLSSGWRAPSINELYSNGLHTASATYEKGNSSLAPEQSFMFDMTLKKQVDYLSAEVSLYNNFIGNYIYQRPDLAPTLTIRGAFPTMVFTQTNANLFGVDAGFTYTWFNHLQTGLNGSYLHAQDLSESEPLLYVPANRVRLSLGYLYKQFAFTRNGLFEIKLNAVARQYRYTDGVDYINPPEGYLLTSVHYAFEWPIGKQQVKVSAGINNLFNTAYRDYLSRFRYFTDDTGINFILRLTIPFQLITKNHEKINQQ